ncbi:MAG TPA: hypothetical protein VGI82_03900 [Chitinophagaceae bacterium]
MGEGNKYAGIVCTENNKIGTECSVPGTSCKYYLCNANSSAAILTSLSDDQMSLYAENHAEELIKTGLIDVDYVPEVIKMMKNALMERNKQLQK